MFLYFDIETTFLDEKGCFTHPYYDIIAFYMVGVRLYNFFLTSTLVFLSKKSLQIDTLTHDKFTKKIMWEFNSKCLILIGKKE